jgi:hypothetical protein
MKQTILLISLSFFLCLLLTAQDSFPSKHIIYKARILSSDSAVHFGFLNRITDSALILSSNPVALGFSGRPENQLQNFHYSGLDKVQLQRKGSVGRGILHGSLIGLATGFIFGLVQGDDPIVTPAQGTGDWGVLGAGLQNAFRMTAFEKGLAGGIAGSVMGAITGGIVGAVAHKRFIIHGKKEKFTSMRLSVLERIYR